MFRRLLFTVALAAGSASAASAQGWIEIERPVRPGLPASPVVRISSNVRTRIDGRVAVVEVEEQFRNAGGGIAEGTYLYPLPGEAVFQNFSLWMGETEVRGEMMNAEQARGIYEEIVRRLRDPALLTLEGHGLIRARVFPIQPGETRRVVLRYTQLLQRAGDALRMRYAIGQRGALPGTGFLDRAPNTPADRFTFRVTVPNADSYGTPYSPTHAITSRRTGDQLLITLDSAASGDVELFVPVRRGLVGTSLVAHAPGGEDGYFMLLVSPAQEDDAPALARDLTFVVDVSGSMSGDKIEQAKAALRQALNTLGGQDRFRLIAFSNRVTNFRDGFAAASPENLEAARRFVDGLQADGGTNIAGALDAALSATVELVQTYPSRLPDVFFGEELVIFGRYHGTGGGEIVVSGQRGGRTERFTAQAVFPASTRENEFIPRLWASRRIGELTRQIRIEGASQNLVQEVRDLGLRYGILTEYTSYLVQEPVTSTAQLQTMRQVMPNQAAPAAPRAQTGAGAFHSARSSSAMMGAGSLAAADAAAEARIGELGAGRGTALSDMRRVHGRLFVKIGEVWTDAAHQDSLRVIEVAPFSEAYFQLVRALPALAQYLRLGDEVLVAGRRASIKVTASGTTAWRAGQLDAVVRAFRGA